jgi:hypothetical protein
LLFIAIAFFLINNNPAAEESTDWSGNRPTAHFPPFFQHGGRQRFAGPGAMEGA